MQSSSHQDQPHDCLDAPVYILPYSHDITLYRACLVRDVIFQSLATTLYHVSYLIGRVNTVTEDQTVMS